MTARGKHSPPAPHRRATEASLLLWRARIALLFGAPFDQRRVLAEQISRLIENITPLDGTKPELKFTAPSSAKEPHP